jgi:DNA-binding transcriptional regulator GbsR (MarR family)
MTLFSLNVSDDYLCQGFNKDFDKISKINFIKRRKAFRKTSSRRIKRVLNEIRKLNTTLQDGSHYTYSKKEENEIKTTVLKELGINRVRKSLKKQCNKDKVKQLLQKQSDLEMQIKSLKNEITLLANDI